MTPFSLLKPGIELQGFEEFRIDGKKNGVVGVPLFRL